MFSAGLAEYPLPGAALGPTFTCIIGIQFYNLKYGDRFWFEHGYQVHSFTPGNLHIYFVFVDKTNKLTHVFYTHTHQIAQLHEIRKITLAKLICANSDDIQYVQKNAFRGESERYDFFSFCSFL
mgnify:CR=1 FL=1